MKDNTLNDIPRRFKNLADTLCAQLRTQSADWFSKLTTLAKDPEFRTEGDPAMIYQRYDTLDAFNAARETLESSFVDALLTGLYQAQAPNATSVLDTDLNSLSLVGTDEVELNITTTGIIQRAEGEHKEALLHLELRLKELGLLSGTRLNPLGLHPASLYNPFKTTLMDLDLEARGKVLLCQIFEQVLSPRLKDFYAQAIHTLIEGGVLADDQSLKRAMRAREHAQNGFHPARMAQPPLDRLSTGEFFAPFDTQQWANSLPPATPIPSPAVDAHPAGNPYAVDQESLGALYNYFNVGLPSTPGAGPGGVPVATPVGAPGGGAFATRGDMHPPTYRTNPVVIQALSVVQRKENKDDVPMDTSVIKNELERRLSDAEAEAENAEDLSWEIAETEERIIDFVNKIFTAIFDDEALTDAVKALLSKLQIPIIKVALLDFDFFQASAHPARHLLNELVTLGVRIESKDEPLFKSLDSIINALIEGFDNDLSTFEIALSQLRKLEREETERSNDKEVETQQQALRKSRRSAAKRTVVQTLQRHMNEKELPDPAMDFILRCWAPYMGMIYLKEGKTERWRQSIHALLQIIEAAQPQRTRHELDQLIGSAGQFFNQIDDQLTQSPINKASQEGILSNVRDWFKDLMDRHSAERADKTEDGPVDDDASRQDPQVTLDALIAEVENEVDETETVFKTLLNAIPAEVKPGAWFEIYRGEDKAKRRLKLSAILEDTGQLLFADRTGHGALEVNLEGFLEDLRENRTQLIDDSNRFDRALTAVICNIRENQEKHLVT